MLDKKQSKMSIKQYYNNYQKHVTLPTMTSSNVPQYLKDTPLGDKSHFWHYQQMKGLQKELYRSIQLARINLDYQMKYPNECRDNPEHKVLTEPHKEAKIRILKQHTINCKRALVPTVDRPKRMNRV